MKMKLIMFFCFFKRIILIYNENNHYNENSLALFYLQRLFILVRDIKSMLKLLLDKYLMKNKTMNVAEKLCCDFSV